MIENALSVIMGTGSLFAWVTSKKFVVEIRCAKVKEKSAGRVFVYIFRRIFSIIRKSKEWMVQ